MNIEKNIEDTIATEGAELTNLEIKAKNKKAKGKDKPKKVFAILPETTRKASLEGVDSFWSYYSFRVGTQGSLLSDWQIVKKLPRFSLSIIKASNHSGISEYETFEEIHELEKELNMELRFKTLRFHGFMEGHPVVIVYSYALEQLLIITPYIQKNLTSFLMKDIIEIIKPDPERMEKEKIFDDDKDSYPTDEEAIAEAIEIAEVVIEEEMLDEDIPSFLKEEPEELEEKKKSIETLEDIFEGALTLHPVPPPLVEGMHIVAK